MNEYEDAINRLVTSARSTKDQFDEVMGIGRVQGKSDEQIHKDIKIAFKALPKTSFYRNMPQELKRDYTKSPKLELSTKSDKRTVEIKQKVDVQDVVSISELTDTVASAAKQIANQIDPKQPEEPDNIDRPDEQSTDENDDGTEEYHGDAGNDPNLINKYVSEPKLSIAFVPFDEKMAVQIFAALRNKVGFYAYILDSKVYKVEAANVHKLEVKAK